MVVAFLEQSPDLRQLMVMMMAMMMVMVLEELPLHTLYKKRILFLQMWNMPVPLHN